MTAPAVVDSRETNPGGLFAAFPGEYTDGYAFAANAVTAGAKAVLAARPSVSRLSSSMTRSTHSPPWPARCWLPCRKLWRSGSPARRRPAPRGHPLAPATRHGPGTHRPTAVVATVCSEPAGSPGPSAAPEGTGLADRSGAALLPPPGQGRGTTAAAPVTPSSHSRSECSVFRRVERTIGPRYRLAHLLLGVTGTHVFPGRGTCGQV
ncbi:Mur ligase domain-containing protein [Streptomyces sp. NPDC026589]|uniref:Mur ligase domain-containing protein n=1 Tax=Streptomyces sp. NPDC026589 TaxID=3155609 RepID=UPI0034081234